VAADNPRQISVALPIALDRGFSYAIPVAWPMVPVAGTRVLVPFGTRVLVGIVRPSEATATPGELKEVLDVVDEDGPALPPPLVHLCEWMSDYYVAPIGEIYRLALPGLLTHADARHVCVTEAGQRACAGSGPLLGGIWLEPRAHLLLERVAATGPTGIDVAKLARQRPAIASVWTLLASLEIQGLVACSWEDSGTSERTETFVRRTEYLRNGPTDEQALKTKLGRSKQRRSLLDYLESQRSDSGDGWVSLAELRGPFPRVRELVTPLVEAQLVTTREQTKTVDPFAAAIAVRSMPQHPTQDQAAAIAALQQPLREGRFVSALLHGITGSGKTEVYLQLIELARKLGKGAIVLVPEIALTPQLADRFRGRFGEQVAVLHSGLTSRQRLDAWQQIRSGTRSIVIGARSAIFAPVPALGVIVVDEEHDTSFKQEDGVRYHARDLALVRGRDENAVVVLGSATPSLETYELARRERHLSLNLRSRPTPRPLPQVEVVPLSVHRPDPDSLMTGILRQAIRDTVTAREQVIVFLNRRGFTTTLLCEACGSFQQCPDCSAPSMTYHLSRNRLLCHLCGHIEATPERCGTCGGSTLTHGGVGTERVEIAIERELEGVRVLRLDRDAARGRRLLETLDRFRRHDADVLVGTQMLSKGHDFPGVTLVGILQGDHGLAQPDPRAAERTFQLLTQVAGRAGRGDRPGRVIVQAYAVHHPAIEFAAHHDFAGFAERELAVRGQLGNPPAGHLALVRVHGPDPERVEERISRVAAFLRPGLLQLGEGEGVELRGPAPSPMLRINRRVRWQLLLRSRQRGPLRWVLRHLRSQLGSEGRGGSETVALVDVDPQVLS